MFVFHRRLVAVSIVMMFLLACAAYSQSTPTSTGIKRSVKAKPSQNRSTRTSNRRTRTETVDNNETITVHGGNKKSAIEVENDETHWVGHDKTKRVKTVRPKTIRSPRTAASRIKKAPTSTGDQPELQRTKQRKRGGRIK